MVTRNKKIRLMDNNYAELISSSIVKSSELSAFPFTNAINTFRSRVWKPSGRFTISTTNQELYINDGSDKTVSITVGEYTTPALLATQIQTDLNAASANWTVTYDSVGETYKFTIANSGSVTLRLSQTTSAIWDTIGLISSTDLTGTSFVAEEQRNHTTENVTFDLGYNAEILFFAAIGPLDEVFSVSNSATINLMASNLNEWDSPPLTVSLSVSSGGIMKFLDDLSDTSYRYWRFEITDKLNPLGPEGLSLGHIYLGDYFDITSRNVSSGFSKEWVDPSTVLESESGALHFDRKTKYTKFDSLVMQFLSRTDKDELEQLFFDKGITTPLYISLDPTNVISDTIDEFTKYVVFESQPVFTHIKTDTFTMSMSLREAI